MNTAVIFGADGGIGSAVLRQLAEAGWRTIALARHPGRVEAMATLVQEVDVGDGFSVQKSIQAVAMEVEAVQLWVYCIGDITSARVSDMTPDAWSRILAANLTGAFLALHHSLSLLAPDAHLIFVGAISERLRLPGLSAYAAAKAGLEAFVEALAKEERKRRVTLLRPGAVQTVFWDKVPFRMPANALAPAEVARLVLSAYEEGRTGRIDL